LSKIEEDGKSWLRRPKLHKRVVGPDKKKMIPVTVAPLATHLPASYTT